MSRENFDELSFDYMDPTLSVSTLPTHQPHNDSRNERAKAHRPGRCLYLNHDEQRFR